MSVVKRNVLLQYSLFTGTSHSTTVATECSQNYIQISAFSLTGGGTQILIMKEPLLLSTVVLTVLVAEAHGIYFIKITACNL